MAGNYFELAPVTINTSNTLAGIQSVNYDPRLEISSPDSDGSVTKLLPSVSVSKPILDISTLNVAAALGLMSASGTELPFLALSSLKWYGRKANVNAPTFAGGSTTEQGLGSLGVMYMTGVEAMANKEATMGFRSLLASSDGTTHPVAWSQVAAPADPTTIAPYFLDSVTIDGNSVDEIVSISLQGQITEQNEIGMKVYPRLVRPRAVDWTVTVRHNDLTQERLLQAKNSSIAFVLKAGNAGSPTRGTGSITFTVTGMIGGMGSSRGLGGPAAATHVCRGLRSGSNMPLTWVIV